MWNAGLNAYLNLDCHGSDVYVGLCRELGYAPALHILRQTLFIITSDLLLPLINEDVHNNEQQLAHANSDDTAEVTNRETLQSILKTMTLRKHLLTRDNIAFENVNDRIENVNKETETVNIKLKVRKLKIISKKLLQKTQLKETILRVLRRPSKFLHRD